MAIFSIIFQGKFDAAAWSNTLDGLLIMRNAGNITCVIIIACVFLFKMKVSIPGDINKKRFYAIFVNCVLTSVFIIPNVLLSEKYSNKMPVGIFVFNTILCLLLLAINIYSTIKSSELEILRQEMQMQKLYAESLDSMIDKLRGFKHDYSNTVQVIGGYLSLNNLEGLKKYHLQMLRECRFVSNTATLNSYIIENPAVYGLLLSKISYSEVNDIQFVLDVSCKLDVNNIKIYDFCKILGILLDNALEAANMSEKKYVELTAGRTGGDSKLAISITNSYSGEIDVGKIFEDGFTTKDGHTGFGLWEVKKIIAKYDNFFLSTSASKPLLTQTLEIADDCPQMAKAGVNFRLPF